MVKHCMSIHFFYAVVPTLCKTFNKWKSCRISSHLITIVSKLPFKPFNHDKWRSTVVEFQEEHDRRAKFGDLVTFVEKQARAALNPVFRDIQDLSPSKVSVKHNTTDSRQKDVPSSRGSSFITTVEAVTENVYQTSSRNKKQDKNTSSALQKPCLFCDSNYTMKSCQKIKNKPNMEKVQFLKARGLCFGCLTRGHMSKDYLKCMTCQTCQQK